MQLPKFAYIRASSRQEAAALLCDPDSGTVLMAGGTDLLPRIKYGLLGPKAVVSLKGVAARAPALAQDGSIRLDALTTLSALAASALIRQKIPALAAAAAAVGSAEIRNMATLGGNLCQETRCLYYNQRHDFQFVEPCLKRSGRRCYFAAGAKRCQAVFMADTAPVLVCLGAAAEIVGPGDARTVSLEALYSGNALNPIDLNRGEILDCIRVPAAPAERRQAFVKFSWRPGFEYSAVSTAAVMEMETDGRTCRFARIAAGSIAAAPQRMPLAEAQLAGRRPDEDALAAAADCAGREAHPIPHHGYSRAYLAECLRVQVRRVLMELTNDNWQMTTGQLTPGS